MVALNYLGIGPDSTPPDDPSYAAIWNARKGTLPLTTTNCKGLIDAFDTTRDKTTSLMQLGWSDGSGGFTGTNNYLATSATGNPSQKTLQNLLEYKNGVANRCIQQADVEAQTTKYIATNQVGQTGNGPAVASLDANRLVPVSQLPSMGSGYLLGPFGVSWSNGGSASTVTNGPFKFAEWAIQTNAVNFQPLVYMVVNAQTDNPLGRTVIEVRISNGPTTLYSTSNPLVARGTGRSFFTGNQAIAVLPCAATNGQTGGSFYPPTYNTYLTAWLYDAGNGTSTISNATSSIITASAFLMRVLAS